MRRLLPITAALAILAGPLIAASDVAAKDHHEDRRGGQQQERGQQGGRGGGGGERWGDRRSEGPQQDRGRWERAQQRPEPRGEYRGDPRGDPRGQYRGDPRGDVRGEPRGDPRYDPRSDPRYDPRYGPPPGAYAPAPRRGGYLPPQAGGAVIEDPGRYRLRPAPPGYSWVRTPGGMALVQQGTGRVFDVVPY